MDMSNFHYRGLSTTELDEMIYRQKETLMGLTHTGTNRRYWEQRDKARKIVERLARDAEEYGEYRLAHVSEEDVQILRDALKLPEPKKEQE